MTANEQVEVKLLKDNNKNAKPYTNDTETITLDTNDAENNNSDAQQRKL